MAKPTKPIEARQFICNSPGRPLTQEEVREFVLQHDLPPPWGPLMEQALREGFTAAGFRVTRCRCMTTHPVAEIRMTCDTGEPPPMREMRRLLRKVVRGIGSEIMPSGLNCLVRQNRVEAELVLTESVAETSDGPFREG